MAQRAYTREDVVEFIKTGEIYVFSDIWDKCKYPMNRMAGAVNSNQPNRLSSLRYRPYSATVQEIFRIARYFDVHYLVIFRLIERQMDRGFYNRTMYINTFIRPKEEQHYIRPFKPSEPPEE
jgi:hypothetical protein